jgi:hypothetical protein
MKRGMAAGMATFALSASALVGGAGIAYAETGTPQAETPCWGYQASGALDAAQTLTPQGEALLCVKNGDASVWQHLDGLQRPVETWFTYGPSTTLTAGDIGPAISWVSSPVKVDSVCTAVQTPSDGGPSETHTNNTGQYRDFHLLPNMATLQLSGFCNWRKAWNRAPG